MLQRISVPISNHAYDVLVGPGLLDQCGELAAKVLRAGRCALVTDSVVGPLYAGRALTSLKAAGFDPVVVTVPSGESSKSMECAASVCEEMIAGGLDRSSALFALGGGVVGDLAGFVAAIYYRGIPFVQLPTTVVAQVDSSVGGKTGVNAKGGKNLIGAFHQPRLVVADTDTLATLPAREFNEGVAEVIKHAAIRDPKMFEQLNDVPSIVERNVSIKAAIVGEDEFETKGVRALLNFGHTLGHAIENAAGYGRFLHGEAISLGLVAACRLSVEKSGLSETESNRVFRALQQFRLPVTLPSEIATDAIIEAMWTDKKFERGGIRFVLLRRLGDAFVANDVTESDLRRVTESLRAQ